MRSTRRALACCLTLFAGAALAFACYAEPSGPTKPPAESKSTIVQTSKFAFWNVENLFDAEDDPHNKGDDEYLPDRGWTAERYATKLSRLAEVIHKVDPSVIGFAEVENRRVLEDLFAHKMLAAKGYTIVHRDSPDKRGIDLALAYRAPFSVDDSKVALRTIDIPKPTRGVLSVPLTSGGRTLHVLVNHWPSRGGGEEAKGFRRKAAEVCRAEIARIKAAAPKGTDPDILLIGDFNDDPYDPSVRDALGAVRSKNAVLNRNNKSLLYNPSWKFLGQPDVGTLYYNREWVWNVFDQAIVSRGMLDEKGFSFEEGSLGIYAPDELRDHYRRPKRFRKNRRSGEWDEGYSDHFLIHGAVRHRVDFEVPPRD